MPRGQVRVAALVAAALVLVPVSLAAAHQRAALAIVSPAEGEVVGGDLDVVVTAAGGALSRADFTMTLDGRPVDTSGRVGAGSVFTTFSLAAAGRLRLSVDPPAGGQHELRLVYTRDPDDPRPDVVRRFSTAAEANRSGPAREVLLLAAIAVLAAAVLLRRRHLAH